MHSGFGRGTAATEPTPTDAGVATADEGMATAELAVALPTLFVVLALALLAVGGVTAKLRCTDAAASAARLIARGESRPAAVAAAQVVASAGSHVRITKQAGEVTVAVIGVVRWPGLGVVLPTAHVTATVTEPLEPGVAG